MPVADEKTQWANDSEWPEALGFTWWRTGALTVKPSTVAKLVNLTLSALSSVSLSPREMQRLIGLWTWPCLLRRPLLSVFDTVYKLASADRPHSRRTLLRSQKDELSQMLALAPLLYADLSLPFSDRIYCSDACPTGGGVVYADLGGREFEQFLSNTAETRVTKG